MLIPPYASFDTSDGVRLRYGYWSSQSTHRQGTVVLLGGRAEFMEKYLETIGEINGRGLDVFSFDWRGQGGSRHLLADTTKGHVSSYDDYVNDLKQLLEKTLAPDCPKPIYLLAHSMGAHIALHYLSQCPHTIQGAVLLAPMVGIHTRPMPPAVLGAVSHLMAGMGWQRVVLPGPHRNDLFNKSFERNRLTSDPVRFQRAKQILLEQPQLAVAGVTFGWLSATFRAIERLHAPGFIERIEIPILLFLAGNDKIVSNDATLRLVRKLPDKKIISLPQARHEILQERNDIQYKFWHAFDAFVQGGS